MNPFRKIIHAMGCTTQGIIYAAKNEMAFGLELILAIIAIPVAVILPVTITAKILMICSIIFILITELINSAIEATIDRISLDRHPLSKCAKDMGSAVVFFAFVQAIVVWVGFLLFAR